MSNTTVLQLDEVGMTFGKGDSEVNALSEVSLAIESGELVVLLGPSGSGKSTLLSVAGALLTPTSGKVHLDDQDVAEMSEADRVRMRLERIGFIFQGANLLSYLTGREQLLFIGDLTGMPRNEAAERADHLLETLGMEKRGKNYPGEMSGGERQRIAIARSLMNNPRLILADEPTASLDSERGHQVVEMLAREVHETDRAGILVTHDERLLDACDRVIRIADGRVTMDESTSAA
jgi:putative ABC transport system ATP-binding protein